MIYRCTFQNFLVYAIDYFTRDELVSIQYAIVSAKVTDEHRATNINRFNDLYPDTETIIAYMDSGDKDILRKMYKDMIMPGKETRRDRAYSSYFTSTIYKAFIKPLLNHNDVMIICDKGENDYIDILCECLKEYDIEVIDLNQLFETGRVGPIYIDRDEIYNRSVDIRRAAVNEEKESLATTRDGRAHLIHNMSTKEKIKRMKKYGIKVRKEDLPILDKMLLEVWCEEEPVGDTIQIM